MSSSVLRVRGARQHNLRDIDVDLPHDALTVVTGPSGSGKSSLAVDVVYAEGQRRYLAGVSAHARRFLERVPRPDVESVEGVRPAVSVARRTGRPGARSTVGTATEILDYLRLLFARAGEVVCDDCGVPVPRATVADLAGRAREAGGRLVVAFPARADDEDRAEALRRRGYHRVYDPAAGAAVDLRPGGGEVWVVQDRTAASRGGRVLEAVEAALREGHGRAGFAADGGPVHVLRAGRVCGGCDRDYPEPEPRMFSFNSPAGACPECEGFGFVLRFDTRRMVPRPELTLDEGALHPWAGKYRSWFRRKQEASPRARAVPRDVPWRELPEADRTVLLEGGPGFPGVLPWLERLARKRYKRSARFVVQRYRAQVRCPACDGGRLGPDARRVRLAGESLPDWCERTLSRLLERLRGLHADGVGEAAAAALVPEIVRRLAILERVGLGYLTPARLARTLSGGEMQRIDLARALGGRLTGALYVLDEPTVGLHPRDTERMLAVLRDLRDLGNTLVVVEHDLDVLRHADHLVELGPGSGRDGGQVVYAGPREGRSGGPPSTTLDALEGRLPAPRSRLRSGRGRVGLRDARLHNLRGVDVDLPFGALVGVCGVSGSGKSTLVREILVPAVREHLEPGSGGEGAATARLVLDAEVRGCTVVDQSPLARSARSVPASYVGVWDAVRRLYASLPDARRHGRKPGWFSFNVAGGRCEACRGEGEVTLDMDFMADVRIPCEVCDGARFTPEARAVRYRGRSVVDVLGMTVDEALALFSAHPAVGRPLWHLQRVGLGYLTLGQPAATLSGGEAQRLKLVRALAERRTGRLLVLDEPTVGLHAAEVHRLVGLLQEMVEAGNGVVVIEHHLDVLAACDWLVELGPGGGPEGGRVVAEGPPAAVARADRSPIAAPLAAHAPGTGERVESGA